MKMQISGSKSERLTLPCSGSVGPFSIAILCSLGTDFSLKTLQELNKSKLTLAVCISWMETYLNPVGVQMSSDRSLMGHSIEINDLDMRVELLLQISEHTRLYLKSAPSYW